MLVARSWLTFLPLRWISFSVISGAGLYNSLGGDGSLAIIGLIFETLVVTVGFNFALICFCRRPVASKGLRFGVYFYFMVELLGEMVSEWS